MGTMGFNKIKFRTGTKEQFNNLESKDSTTFYRVTDGKAPEEVYYGDIRLDNKRLLPYTSPINWENKEVIYLKLKDDFDLEQVNMFCSGRFLNSIPNNELANTPIDARTSLILYADRMRDGSSDWFRIQDTREADLNNQFLNDTSTFGLQLVPIEGELFDGIYADIPLEEQGKSYTDEFGASYTKFKMYLYSNNWKGMKKNLEQWISRTFSVDPFFGSSWKFSLEEYKGWVEINFDIYPGYGVRNFQACIMPFEHTLYYSQFSTSVHIGSTNSNLFELPYEQWESKRGEEYFYDSEGEELALYQDFVSTYFEEIHLGEIFSNELSLQSLNYFLKQTEYKEYPDFDDFVSVIIKEIENRKNTEEDEEPDKGPILIFNYNKLEER